MAIWYSPISSQMKFTLGLTGSHFLVESLALFYVKSYNKTILFKPSALQSLYFLFYRRQLLNLLLHFDGEMLQILSGTARTETFCVKDAAVDADELLAHGTRSTEEDKGIVSPWSEWIPHHISVFVEYNSPGE